MIYMALLIVPLLLGFWAQSRVTGNFRRYAQVPSTVNLTGAQVARSILDRNGLTDVEVRHTPGELSDHYDPRNRTVNLSDSVFGANSVSAVSVAAHEVGHALQHAGRYAPLSFRSALLPAAQLGSNLFMVLFVVGAVFLALGNVLGTWIMLVAVAFYAFAVLFQLVTLPVEFNASSRARVQLQQMGAVGPGDAQGTSAVLNAAALTYVAGALMAVAQLVYFAMMFLGGEE